VSKMKSKSQLGEKNVRKLIQEYWKTIEPEKEQDKRPITNLVAGSLAQSKVKK